MRRRVTLKRIGSAPMSRRVRTFIRRLWVDRSGATAIEYALIVVLISILIVGWASSIGTSVTNFFLSVNNGF